VAETDESKNACPLGSVQGFRLSQYYRKALAIIYPGNTVLIVLYET
jgi:hypothetical protein